VLVAGVDDVDLDRQIVVDELGRVGVVRMNSANLGGSKKNVVRLFLSEEGLGGRLIGQIEIGVSPSQDVGEAFPLKIPHDSRADETAVASDVDFGILVHCVFLAIRDSQKRCNHAS